jgi:hypothetical protein
LTPREDEVDEFVNLLESANLKPLEAFQRERLLAEIAFGDLNATSTKSHHLATRAFSCVENHWSMPLRKALLDTIIDGLNSATLRQAVIEKLRDWFPDPIPYRVGIYDVLARWPFEMATVRTMMRGLREDNDWTQKPAAYALAKYAGGNDEVGAELLALAKSPVSADVAAGCLLSLSRGWPSLDGVAALLEQATRSRSTALTFAGNIGLVNLGKRDEALRETLLAMANAEARGLFRWESEIADALVIGWPGDKRIKRIAMESVSEPWPSRHKIKLGVAGIILVNGYPQDDGIATLLADRIKKGQGIHFVGPGSSPWEHLAKKFSEHPIIVASVAKWLEEKEHILGFDLYHAAMCTKSPVLKAELLRKLKKPQRGIFWVVNALIDAWGAEDGEVAAALKEFASDTTVDDDLGDTLLRLPLQPEEQKRRLLAALASENPARRFSIIMGLGKIRPDLKTDEVVDAALLAAGRPSGEKAGQKGTPRSFSSPQTKRSKASPWTRFAKETLRSALSQWPTVTSQPCGNWSEKTSVSFQQT